MDLSAIIVTFVLSALSLAAIVWMQMQSRGRKDEGASAAKAGAGVESSKPARSVAEKSISGSQVQSE